MQEQTIESSPSKQTETSSSLEAYQTIRALLLIARVEVRIEAIENYINTFFDGVRDKTKMFYSNLPDKIPDSTSLLESKNIGTSVEERLSKIENHIKLFVTFIGSNYVARNALGDVFNVQLPTGFPKLPKIENGITAISNKGLIQPIEKRLQEIEQCTNRFVTGLTAKGFAHQNNPLKSLFASPVPRGYPYLWQSVQDDNITKQFIPDAPSLGK
jgi:hypothetical protein